MKNIYITLFFIFIPALAIYGNEFENHEKVILKDSLIRVYELSETTYRNPGVSKLDETVISIIKQIQPYVSDFNPVKINCHLLNYLQMIQSVYFLSIHLIKSVWIIKNRKVFKGIIRGLLQVLECNIFMKVNVIRLKCILLLFQMVEVLHIMAFTGTLRIKKIERKRIVALVVYV